MNDLLTFFKALSDETRLRLVVLLTKQDYCVCELTEILALSQPKISKHLSKLRDLGFVKTKREAQFIYYQLTINNQAMEAVLQGILDHMHDYEVLVEDSKRIAQCTLMEKGDLR